MAYRGASREAAERIIDQAVRLLDLYEDRARAVDEVEATLVEFARRAIAAVAKEMTTRLRARAATAAVRAARATGPNAAAYAVEAQVLREIANEVAVATAPPHATDGRN